MNFPVKVFRYKPLKLLCYSKREIYISHILFDENFKLKDVLFWKRQNVVMAKSELFLRLQTKYFVILCLVEILYKVIEICLPNFRDSKFIINFLREKIIFY